MITKDAGAREHAERYKRIALWLGVDALKKLVPFTREQIVTALANGDEHLNTLLLHVWDAKHGHERRPSERKVCSCCKQVIIPKIDDMDAGVLGLVRAAIRRDRDADRMPLMTAWSLSDTVCVLKHVAEYHVAKGEG